MWNGPYRYNEVMEQGQDDHKAGLYMIYGNHPVYGTNVLLYIGRTFKNTKNRIENHELIAYPELDCQIYFGYPIIQVDEAVESISEKIEVAEALLIERHFPALNRQLEFKLLKNKSELYCVLNWNARRSLQADVSNFDIVGQKMNRTE